MQETYKTDIRKLNEHLLHNPSSMLFARLADRYLSLQEIEKAIDICQNGLRHHPNYSSAYYVLAKCFFARKQYDEAERRLKRVISLEPSFLKAHKLYSDLMAEIGWTQSSHSSLRKIHEIDPLFPLLEEANIEEVKQVKPVAPPPKQPTLAPVTTQTDAKADLLDMDSIMGDYPIDSLNISEELYEEPITPPPTIPPAMLTPSPEIEEDLLSDLPTDDFEKEEARFSEILDDLFSPRMVEEEQAENETRTIIERAGRVEQPLRPASAPVAAKPEPVLPPPKSTPADRLTDQFFKEERKQTAPVPPAVNPTPEPASKKNTAQEKTSTPVQEIAESRDPFALKMDDLKPFESEEKDFSSFLSTLDEMGDTEDEISFDAELLQTDAEPVAFEQSEESFSDFLGDDSETPINAKSRAEKPKEKFVTPTLGEIYAAQGQYAKAISVFELLLKKNPENEWYKTKLDYLKKKNQEEHS